MKKIIYTVAALLFYASCSKPLPSDDVSAVFDGLSRVRNFSEAGKYYTKDSMALVEDSVKGGLLDEKSRLLALPSFGPGIKWSEISKNVRGDRATVKIRYTEHPVENMTGYEMVLELVKEDGGWKIDISGSGGKGGNNKGPRDYIENLRVR
ncbi:MAG: hypothetical protein MUD12_02145 [Spirochaetes bacterium]|jgi:hypothetical protein|nr:hypothetical protein [Spirochaetota bacterium]